MPNSVSAADAMAHAEAAHVKVEAHEDLCAERYANLHLSITTVRDSVSEIKKIIGWGGALLASVLIGLVGFFGAMAISNNKDEVNQLRAQVQVMQAERSDHPK